MDKTRQKILIISSLILIVLLFAIGMIIVIIRGKVPDNPPGTIGNTAGNLNNAGYFCEKDGKVYFHNSYDGGALYVMNIDETGMERLNTLITRNILVAGDYIYYFQLGSSGVGVGMGGVRVPKSFNRCKLNGDDTASFTRDMVVTAQLVDNYVYMLIAGDDHPSFRKERIDKTDEVTLAEYAVNPACAAGSRIFYNGTESDHFLYSLDTNTDIPTEVFTGDVWYPVVYGSYIYYLDPTNGYRICRYSMADGTSEVLTDNNDHIDYYNVGGGYIYYQTSGKNPGLYMCYDDGDYPQLIAEGAFNSINMTSQAVYFMRYDDDVTMYKSYIGSGSISEFSAAKAAAELNRGKR